MRVERVRQHLQAQVRKLTHPAPGSAPYPTSAGFRERASNTTRFFRNYPQLLALVRTVPLVWTKPARLESLHLGGSWGCEALSFQIVMRERLPAYVLRSMSTDLDADLVRAARRMEYEEQFFQPFSAIEGGNPDGLREKWFVAKTTNKHICYRPKPEIARQVRFHALDLRTPSSNLQADIVFCQNVLIHMELPLAEECLGNALQMVRPRGILVCAGMPLDLKARVPAAGFVPVTDSIQEIHDTWESQRMHYRERRGEYYFELEDFDASRSDWATRYGSIFVRQG